MSRLILPFLLAFLLAPAVALATPPAAVPGTTTWGVRVSGAGPCVHSPQFAADLAAQVPEEKRPPEGASPALVAEVQMVSAAQATVRVLEGGNAQSLGARDILLPGSGCDSAAETIGFVLGVLFQTDRGFAPEPEPIAEPEPPPTPPPTPPDPPPAPVRSRQRFGDRYSWLGPRPAHEVSVSAGALLGLLPGVPFGGRFAWTIRGATSWPTTLWVSGWRRANTDIAKSTFGAAFGGVATCPLHHEGTRIHARACAGLGAGATWAEARAAGLFNANKWRAGFVLLGLSGNLAVRLAGPLFLELSLQVDTAQPRRTFTYTTLDNRRKPIYQTSWVTGAAFLGPSLRFR